jgi:hypothetical protein
LIKQVARWQKFKAWRWGLFSSWKTFSVNTKDGIVQVPGTHFKCQWW